jgi:hypothetical protein
VSKPKPPPPATVAYLKQLWSLFIEDRRDVEYLETIITRTDRQNGADQLKDITEICEGNSKMRFGRRVRRPLTPWQLHNIRTRLSELVWSTRISAYRQRFVVVTCAQRKEHPLHKIPSLGNMVPPQSCRIEALTCYGLGYAQARNHLVKSALSHDGVTHILFLDDDVLVPNDGIAKLLDAMASSGIKIMGGIYEKKHASGGSVVTTSADDAELIYGNHAVPAVKDDYEPQLVGCTGLGFTLVEASVFRRMPEPWFQFVQEENSKRVVVGEDSFFIQKAAYMGVQAAVLPGVVGVHVEFKTGRHFGPEWVVDPATRKIRPELVEHYTQFPEDLDLKDLIADDVDDVFGKNKREGEIARLKAVPA